MLFSIFTNPGSTYGAGGAFSAPVAKPPTILPPEISPVVVLQAVLPSTLDA